ncbi:MAG: putative glycolipid-binding domain-containing protein [Anaerolineae bacterium]|nr:putative glycolipid-binding domain-containing protein [Anaerolineae bacterium]
MQRSFLWQTLYQPGLEHFRLESDGNSSSINGVIIGLENQQSFHLNYSLHCAADQTLREATVSSVTANVESRLRLHADGHGNWTNELGDPLPQFAGCFEIDISATPFTNSLPIWRLQLAPQQPTEIEVLYIKAPELQLQRQRQRYTLLEISEAGSLYRFESPDIDFTALVYVDPDGLVTNYVDLFERL